MIFIKRPHPSISHGFTLIELSIVLTIIGLLVGGVMVGQYLIEVALLSKEASTVQKYATAINTFKLKYNNLPGDLPNPTTFFSVLFNGGNGNSIIDNGVTNLNDGSSFTETQLNGAGIYQASEVMAVNVQLAYAGLINEKTYDETINISMVQKKPFLIPPPKRAFASMPIITIKTNYGLDV